MNPFAPVMAAAVDRAAAAGRSTAAWCVVGVLAVVGSGFGLSAVWLVLAENAGAAEASAIMAVGLILIAVVGALILRRRAARRRKLAAARAEAGAQTAPLAPLIVYAFTTAIDAGRALKR